MLWAGLDLGTTHLKVVLYDDAPRQIVRIATARTPTRTSGAHTTHDADELARAAIDLLGSVLHDPDDGRVLGGIAVAGVGEEIVTLDPHGIPLGEVLAWYDPRGSDEAASFQLTSPPTLHRRVPMDASFSLFKLLWLRANRPEELERCARIVDLSGYVLQRLGAPVTMDWSHASRTGLFDPSTASWDAESLAAACIPEEWLPPLVPSGTVVGATGSLESGAAGILPATPLVSGGHDHFCGAYASGVRASGELFLSAGTSEAQLVLLDRPPDTVAGPYVFDQGRYVDDSHWYLHVGRPFGQAYRQWRTLLFGDDGDNLVEEELSRASASELGVLFEPAVLGRGSMLAGVTLTADRGTILRSVVEGSAVASARVTRALEDAAGTMRETIVVSGHAAQSALWRGLRLGLTRRSMELVDEPEAAALGAALLAQRAITGAADRDAVRRTRLDPTPSDLAAAAALEARYERWLGAAAHGM